MSGGAAAGLSVLLVACGGAAPIAPAERPVAPGPSTTKATPPVDVFALPGEREADKIPEDPKGAPDLDAWRRLKSPKGLPARPATCKFAKPSKAPGTCVDESTSLTQLDSALSKPEAERDAALAALEGCKLPVGFITALRAELAAPECADALTDPWLDKLPAEAKPALVHTFVGQSLGAKLARSVLNQPTVKPPYTKPQIEAFLKTKLGPWALEQARLVQDLSAAGAQLTGIGQAIVATEAGRADLRFVEVARQVPAAPEFAKDPELKQIYESTLEQALEPRKARGRDATLVGLRAFADFGLIAGSKRMQDARNLLGTMYGGRRVDALDALIVPVAAPAEASHRQVPAFLLVHLASMLPTLTAEANAGTANALPPVVRKEAPPASAVADRQGRARTSLRLAAAHFRRASADAALDLVGGLPRDEANEFLLALGLALHQGPKDVVLMMAGGQPASLGYRRLEALDTVAKKGGTFAAAAQFDAALLREVAPPEGANAAYFNDLAAQYRAAAGKFGAAPEAKLAEERARHAEQIARAATP